MMKWLFARFRMTMDFFPLHLLASHFKYNIVGLFYWLFLFLIIFDQLGTFFGLPYLFLSPEYHGETSTTAFLLLGFSVGGFIMGFHAYSYIRLGAYYPFIATLNRPFFKFCINNSALPMLFLILMMVNIYYFQIKQEYVLKDQALGFLLAFFLGVFLFIMLSFLYFFPTNKDLFRLTGKTIEDFEEKESTIQSGIHKKGKWSEAYLNASEKRYYYIGKHFLIKQSRSCAHYDNQLLNSVFAQNHTNASYFEIALVISFFLVGFFKDFEVFQVPAAVSIMMLLTIIIMLVSAMFSWFKQWTYPIILGVFLLMNYLSLNSEWLKFQSYALGLSYEKEDMIPFTPELVRETGLNAKHQETDYLSFLETLNNWKFKQKSKKPKLVIINTSGGGLRSALWTFSVIQHLDSLTQGEFSNQIQMITGASGGMVGAAYYRELMELHQQGKIESKYAKEYRTRIGKDLLNRLAFSIATNDIFFRFQRIEIDGNSYIKDRGIAFEQELNANLGGVFDRNLGDYYEPEKKALIPTMIFTPTIVNDGRRLLIGAQPLGFLQRMPIAAAEIGMNTELENIEYNKFFHQISPEKLAMTSILRMNASFPYIMPMVTLPTVPSMHIMDAGIRDNYGTKITSDYLLALRDWIKQNTSGVVLIKIRDTKKALLAETYDNIGLMKKLFFPIGNLYGNFPRVQDFDQDALLIATWKATNIKMDVITFNLRERFEDKIALSWHLTKNEKFKIQKSLASISNQYQTEKLLKLLK